MAPVGANVTKKKKKVFENPTKTFGFRSNNKEHGLLIEDLDILIA